MIQLWLTVCHKTNKPRFFHSLADATADAVLLNSKMVSHPTFNLYCCEGKGPVPRLRGTMIPKYRRVSDDEVWRWFDEDQQSTPYEGGTGS